ncbi:unnamed protein product [Brassica oleracea var. botrytis]
MSMSDDRFKDSSLFSMRSLVTLENCLFFMCFYCHDENRLKVALKSKCLCLFIEEICVRSVL